MINVLEKLDTIKDIYMRNAFENYVIRYNREYPKNDGRMLNLLVNLIEGIALCDLNWNTTISILNKKIEVSYQSRETTIFNFIYYLIDNNLYQGNYKLEYNRNRNDFLRFINGSFAYKKALLQRPYVNPESFVLFIDVNKTYRVITIQKPNINLVKLIREYLNDDNDIMNQRKKLDRDVPVLNLLIEGLEDKYFINSINDFSDSTFFQHFNYMKEKLNDILLGNLLNFYGYIIRKMDSEIVKDNFKYIDNSVLKYSFIIKKLREGYRIVNYNVYDEPPLFSKMLLKENNMDINSTKPKDTIVVFENNFVKNTKLQRIYTDFFWKDCYVSFLRRRKHYYSLRDFLVQIDKNFTPDDNVKMDAKDILSYKNSVTSLNISDSSKGRKFTAVKSFLNFCDANNYIEIDAILFRLLVHKDSKRVGYKESFTKAEINQLSKAFEYSYKNEINVSSKLLYQLYYYVFTIQSLSEIRLSSILALTLSSLQKTLTRKGKNEYKLVVNSKSVVGEPDEYNITYYVKKLIDEVVAITKDIREVADYPEKICLFIYRRRSREAISIVRDDSYNRYLYKICEENDIRKLPQSAIRNYYQQNISDYVTENEYDSNLIQKLGKHTLSVHIANYDKVDIREFCQRYYETEIGTVYLKGKIASDNKLSNDSTVAKGCGHCSLDKCTLIGKLDCFMCEHFVTTIDRIPYYEKEIKIIDNAIEEESIPHEKEFLFSKKKLLVAYLAKLMELDGEA